MRIHNTRNVRVDARENPPHPTFGIPIKRIMELQVRTIVNFINLKLIRMLEPMIKNKTGPKCLKYGRKVSHTSKMSQGLSL